MNERHPLMTPVEVATLFRVRVATVARWRQAGKLATIPTPGGRTRRFFRAQVEAIMRGEDLTADEITALRSQLGGAR